jgi:rare lipoprotein A
MAQPTNTLALAAIIAALAVTVPTGSALAQEPAAAAGEAQASAQIRRLQHGVASWYGPGFHGRRTASGERFNTHDLTAAHRTLPFGSRVTVVNEKTGRSVVVRINDRGPYAHGRVIDLSQAAAKAIGVDGVARVRVAQTEVEAGK